MKNFNISLGTYTVKCLKINYSLVVKRLSFLSNPSMRVSLLLIGLFFIMSSCKKDNDLPLESNSPVFDIDLFEEKIKDGLTFESVGFCYVITDKGILARSGAIGRRIAGQDGIVGQDLNQPMYCASISKAITAAAALKLLEKMGKDELTKITEFIPSHWNPGTNVKNLTIRNLLQHQSGFRGWGVTYASLKGLVEADIDPDDKVYDYENTNYALFRIMIPYMNGDIDLDLIDDAEIDLQTSQKYKEYIQKNLFEPFGITNTDVKPVGAQPTLYYNYPNYVNTRGWEIGDRTTISGGGGWYVSPIDLANFFANLEFTEEILSNEFKTLMDDNFLGWDQSSSASGSNNYGVYHAKNGALGNSDIESENQGVKNLVKKFNNDIQVIIMINSRGGDHDSEFGSTSLNSLIRDAFDESWVQN